MRKIKVCFVGFGSIAKRHIKNLHKIFNKCREEIVIDVFRSGKGSLKYDEIEEIVNLTYYDFDVIPSDYDIIFITNPTKYHFESLNKFHEKGMHFFVEKPVFDRRIDLSDFHFRKESVYYVACPLRYSGVISYIKEEVDLSKVYSVRSICSSYLPDWRPNQDYRKTYSAQKKMGGGVSIDLIHEWDYLQYLFGFPNNICSIIKNISSLEIDSDDLAVYIAEYEDKIVELHLDYFGRKTIRKIEIFREDETIVGDLIHNKIIFLKSGKELCFDESRDDYQIRELEYFLSKVKDVSKGKNNEIDVASKVLELCKGGF